MDLRISTISCVIHYVHRVCIGKRDSLTKIRECCWFLNSFEFNETLCANVVVTVPIASLLASCKWKGYQEKSNILFVG